MGSHLSVVTLQGEQHPGWERVRHRDDHAFVQLVRHAEITHPEVTPSTPDQYAELFRPTPWGISTLEVALMTSSMGNKKRYFHLLRLLEDETRATCPHCGMLMNYRWWLEYD